MKMLYDETKPINFFNLPCDIIEDTMINIVYREIEKEDKNEDEQHREHFYEIRFSSAKDDECWIGDSEEVYTLKQAVKVWKIMRQELIDELEGIKNREEEKSKAFKVLGYPLG